MKTIRLLLACAALATLNLQLSTTHAQGTAFTYQGVLSQGGAAVNSSNDLTFTLYNAVSGGVTVGTSNVVSGLRMTNGLFTVTLDFGAGAFNGSDRWLQIAVRPGASTGAYTNLVPRQPVSATPYALFAAGANASTLIGSIPSASLAGNYSAAVTLNNAANNFTGIGSNLTALNASQLTSGTVPAGALSNAWKITGNSNTTPGTHFLGTTDNQPLEFKVNNQRALRMESAVSGFERSVNVIGGYSGNFVSNGVVGATIAGGGATNILGGSFSNAVTGNYGAVGGGRQNTANGIGATVGGGNGNIASGDSATVGGGQANVASNDSATVSGGQVNMANNSFATVGGGVNNTASGTRSTVSGGAGNFATTNFATVGGGFANQASADKATVSGGGANVANGIFATVPGGDQNSATNSAFAAGHRAKAIHSGAFVWADSTDTDFGSTVTNQFNVRANGGVRLVTGGAGVTLDGVPLTSALGTNIDSSEIVDGSIAPSDLGNAVLNGTFWKLGGNSGTSPGTHFIGNQDDQPLEFRVNNLRGLRLEYQEVGANPNVNVIGGFRGNRSENFAAGATIAGGGTAMPGFGGTNIVTGNFNSIGGGHGNRAGGNVATIAGGRDNSTTGDFSVVSGGVDNKADGEGGTIAGGDRNKTADEFGSVGGGRLNVAARFGTVPGGLENFATNFAFAAGVGARAIHVGSFVWSDQAFIPFESTTNDQFSVEARNGVRLVTGGAGLTVDTDFMYVSGKATHGRFGDAASYNFTPNPTVSGLIIEQGTNESSGIFMDGDTITMWSPGDNNRLLRVLDEDGMVEVFYLDGDGDCIVRGVQLISSARFKTNVVQIQGALDKVMRLRGVSFNWIPERGDKPSYGFIAEEVAEVLPELVSWEGEGAARQTVGVEYANMTAVNAEAIKELNGKVDAENAKLRKELKRRDAENAELKQRLEKLEQLVAQKLSGETR